MRRRSRTRAPGATRVAACAVLLLAGLLAGALRHDQPRQEPANGGSDAAQLRKAAPPDDPAAVQGGGDSLASQSNTSAPSIAAARRQQAAFAGTAASAAVDALGMDAEAVTGLQFVGDMGSGGAAAGVGIAAAKPAASGVAEDRRLWTESGELQEPEQGLLGGRSSWPGRAQQGWPGSTQRQQGWPDSQQQQQQQQGWPDSQQQQQQQQAWLPRQPQQWPQQPLWPSSQQQQQWQGPGAGLGSSSAQPRPPPQWNEGDSWGDAAAAAGDSSWDDPSSSQPGGSGGGWPGSGQGSWGQQQQGSWGQQQQQQGSWGQQQQQGSWGQQQQGSWAQQQEPQSSWQSQLPAPGEAGGDAAAAGGEPGGMPLPSKGGLAKHRPAPMPSVPLVPSQQPEEPSFCDPRRGLEPQNGHCVCIPGYGTDLDGMACSRCPVGWYSKGGPLANAYCRPCPELTTSNPLRTACTPRASIQRPDISQQLCDLCPSNLRPFDPPACCPKGQKCCGQDGCCERKSCIINATTGNLPQCCGASCNLADSPLKCCKGDEVCINTTAGASVQECCDPSRVCGSTSKACCGSESSCCNGECCRTRAAVDTEVCRPNDFGDSPPDFGDKCCPTAQINCNGTCCATAGSPPVSLCVQLTANLQRVCCQNSADTLCQSSGPDTTECCQPPTTTCRQNTTLAGRTQRKCCTGSQVVCAKSVGLPICCPVNKCPSTSDTSGCLP